MAFKIFFLKEIRLTIIDVFEDLTVSCALESDNKKLEFKFGLVVDSPQDIASKLVIYLKNYFFKKLIKI